MAAAAKESIETRQSILGARKTFSFAEVFRQEPATHMLIVTYGPRARGTIAGIDIVTGTEPMVRIIFYGRGGLQVTARMSTYRTFEATCAAGFSRALGGAGLMSFLSFFAYGVIMARMFRRDGCRRWHDTTTAPIAVKFRRALSCMSQIG